MNPDDDMKIKMEIVVANIMDKAFNELDAKDAARYRWLNNQDNFIIHIEQMDRIRHYRLKCGDVLDKWIDERLVEERSRDNLTAGL